jgi:hypothetical protein
MSAVCAGRLPVATHLRPRPEGERDWCPLYQRLAAPADREAWRWYDLAEFLPLAEAEALPTAGQA